MSSDANLTLTFQLKRLGAWSVAAVTLGTAFTGASRAPSTFQAPSRSAARLQLGRVASLRAGLRSSAVAFRSSSLLGSSRSAVSRSVAVRSASRGLRQARLCRAGHLPNISLVPTPVSDAPSLRLGSGAAQLKRSADNSEA